MAGLSDFLIDKSGTYHAVFQESPGIGKPLFIYYASSTDKGASWSKPVTLSNDNTGNGAGYPRILQGGSGKIYAIWKRYGKVVSGTASYPVGSTMDGPGGNGTVFYKVLNGGTWSAQVMLADVEATQNSWCATVAPNGNVYVFWSQSSPATIQSFPNNVPWYYCDLLRVSALNGTGHSAFVDLSTPSAPNYAGGYPAKTNGIMNLHGYVDKANKAHLIYEDTDHDIGKIEYSDGVNPHRTVYSYPAYKQGLSFENPARLLVDEKGNDHVIFVPAPSTLESEQVWDVNMATNKTEILTAIQQQGISIHGFQAYQGPNGAMAVTIEAGRIMGSNEAFGMFYSNGAWKNVGLTNNASKGKFFSKDFVGLGGYLTNVSLLTSYSSTFTSVAYDGSGRKSLLMTISGNTVGNSGYGTSAPFVVYMPVDH